MAPSDRRLAQVIDSYPDASSFDELQSCLQAALALRERRGNAGRAEAALRAAEADLEEIRFLVAEDEWPFAVAPVLERLRPALEDPRTASSG